VCVIDASSSGSYAAGDALKIEVNTSFKWFGVIGASGGIMGSASSTISATATNRIEAAMVSGTTTNPFLTPVCSS